MCVLAISTFSTGKYAGFDRIICGSLSSNIPVAAIPVSVGSSVYKRINRLRRNYLLVSKFKAIDTISAYSKQLAHASCPEDIKIKHIMEVPSCSPAIIASYCSFKHTKIWTDMLCPVYVIMYQTFEWCRKIHKLIVVLSNDAEMHMLKYG